MPPKPDEGGGWNAFPTIQTFALTTLIIVLSFVLFSVVLWRQIAEQKAENLKTRQEVASAQAKINQLAIDLQTERAAQHVRDENQRDRDRDILKGLKEGALQQRDILDKLGNIWQGMVVVDKHRGHRR
jgi:hypothetical protein